MSATSHAETVLACRSGLKGKLPAWRIQTKRRLGRSAGSDDRSTESPIHAVNRQLSRRGPLIGSLGALLAQTDFRETIAGSVIVSNDGEYDSARRVFSFNPRTDKHPPIIVRCAARDEAAKAIISTLQFAPAATTFLAPRFAMAW